MDAETYFHPLWIHEENLLVRSVNIAELKNQLSKYLTFAKAGVEIVIRDRNLPVAKLVPFSAAGASEEELRGWPNQMIKVGIQSSKITPNRRRELRPLFCRLTSHMTSLYYWTACQTGDCL